MRSDHMGYVCAKLMLKPDLQNTEHGLDPEVLRNAGSKVVAICCAATSSVIVPLAAPAILLRAERPRSRCDSKTPTPAEDAPQAQKRQRQKTIKRAGLRRCCRGAGGYQ